MAIYIPSCSDINCTAGGPCNAPCQPIYFALNNQYLGSTKFQTSPYIDSEFGCVVPDFTFDWGGVTWNYVGDGHSGDYFPTPYYFGVLGDWGYGFYFLQFDPYTIFNGDDCIQVREIPQYGISPISVRSGYEPVEVPPLPTTDPCIYPPPDNP